MVLRLRLRLGFWIWLIGREVVGLPLLQRLHFFPSIELLRQNLLQRRYPVFQARHFALPFRKFCPVLAMVRRSAASVNPGFEILAGEGQEPSFMTRLYPG